MPRPDAAARPAKKEMNSELARDGAAARRHSPRGKRHAADRDSGERAAHRDQWCTRVSSRACRAAVIRQPDGDTGQEVAVRVLGALGVHPDRDAHADRREYRQAQAAEVRAQGA